MAGASPADVNHSANINQLYGLDSEILPTEYDSNKYNNNFYGGKTRSTMQLSVEDSSSLPPRKSSNKKAAARVNKHQQ